MAKKQTRRIHVTERDRRILAHVRQYRITTVEALHASLFADRDRDAVKSTLRRLYGKPPHFLYLRPEPLDTRRVYYRLTARGARLIGAPKDLARPLGLQARCQHYAILWLICIDQPGCRSLVEPQHLLKDQMKSGERLPRKNFYINQTDTGELQLGYVMVDHRSDSRRLVRKACTTLERFLRRGWFDDFIVTRAFALTLLTATDEKRKTLEQRLNRRLPQFLKPHLERLRLPASELPINVSVHVVPGLSDVLPFS